MALNGINDADMKAPQKVNNKQRRSVRLLNIGRSPYVIILLKKGLHALLYITLHKHLSKYVRD